jgi:hypothetical protein
MSWAILGDGIIGTPDDRRRPQPISTHKQSDTGILNQFSRHSIPIMIASPPGTSTVSPICPPSTARASGETWDTVPRAGSASSSPTMRNVCARSIIAAHGHCGPEMYFIFIGCRFYDLRARPSRIPVSKFASRRCDRRPVIFSYRGLICSFKTAKCPLDRGKAFSCYEVRMHRYRSIRQVVNFVLDFLNERAAHCPRLRSYVPSGGNMRTTSARTTCSLLSWEFGKHL